MDSPTPAERFAVYQAIVDSLLPLVGQPLTPALIETIQEISASHVREHGFVVIPLEAIEELKRRLQ